MNLPNKLTILRIFLVPIFLIFLLYPFLGQSISRFISVIIFIIAALTDALDGHIARKYNLITNFGKLMDPLADKLLVCSALIALVQLGRISSIVAIIIIGREFLITGFRLIALEENIVIAASNWGKLKTISQMVMIPFKILFFKNNLLGIIGNILVYLSVILAIISAVDYIVKNINVIKNCQ